MEGHPPVSILIALVANQHQNGVGRGVKSDFVDPVVLNVLKAAMIGDVVHAHYTVR